ncbi:MAG: ribose-phosphate diphosphokinase [Rhodopseudomonas palustris]|nr:MAG: ribose-phosphate diphosphokinase [Rhodopseudomonas palustris]
MSAVRIVALPESSEAARRLAVRLGVPIDLIEQHRFPDGELRVRVGDVAPTMLIYASLDRPNDKLIALLFACEALRRGGAQRIVLIAPYLCYMRQDTAFRPGEAISQRVIGQLLGRAVDRVITVDAHLHRTPEISAVFADIEAENLSAAPAMAAALSGSLAADTIVVGPDAESLPWVSNLASRLGCDCAVATKTRRDDRTVEVGFADPTQFVLRPVLLVDDIVSSGGTLIACAKALRAAGATYIDAVITHALFPLGMLQAFSSAGIRTMRSTDSVAHPTNAIALDALFAEALHNELVSPLASGASR